MNTEGESSTSSHFSYDVFLSFRGEDTRNNFTGHLYTRLCQVGVNTFIDDEELRKGEVISNKLEKAIEESRVSIVVFSKSYASSSWCLDELVKILECKEKLNQTVLPVFYDVDPSQVRKQNGCFGEGLGMLKERSFGAERVEKWKAALTEAANLSGWDLLNVANGHESKFIGSIIKQVLREVNQTPLDVAWHPVGVDSRLKAVELLLESGCEHEVRMVGICGVGGIGKTTLAKAIYNRIFRQFGSSCFLSDVRSEAEAFGLVKLQEKLLNQILKTKDVKVSTVAEGVNLIKARLGSKKVLIILDDVDQISQLESLTRERSWFGSGSLIIITTRDDHLLCQLRENERYEARLLNDNEAMQLFCLHAVNSPSPPHDYVNLSKFIIKYSGGLPLALVILGSHLQGRSVEEWRYEFTKLRAVPHCDIQRILQISFDGLDDNTQSVFLDIACAFHGFPKDEVTKTLNACGFYSESAISTLVQRNLLQRDWHYLVMHDLVRDMGREIVRMESRDPGKRSRLFNPQEVRDVLQGNKGSKNVEVLVVERRALEGKNLSTEAFQKMINLRVLKIDGKLHISGDFELLSKELRWLSWKECPLKCIPSNFPAERLVVLNMKGSNIREFGLNLQYCRSLKGLDLSNCKRLRRTPNFTGSRSLETLRLSDCSSLKEIHQSIGNLGRLTYLLLDSCEKITDLPSSICQLKSLQSLDISCCSSLQKLPVDLGDMQSLISLRAYDTDIKQFPGSVEMLRDLLVLEVGGRNLEGKRSFYGRRVQIQSLSSSIRLLNLTYCNLSETDIPGDAWSLSNLMQLDLSGNNFRCLHLDFSKLRLLWSLSLNDCENLHSLSSVSNNTLSTLEIANCKKLVDITGLDNLPLGGRINMLNCTSLQNPFSEGFFSSPALAFRRKKLKIYLQSNKIPDWCGNQVTASSICFSMPTEHNKEYQFLGMILWCVHKFDKRDILSYHRGLKFGIVGKKYSVYKWHYDYKMPDGQQAEQSCVLYTSCLRKPFDGQIMQSGEKMKIAEIGVVSTVKKIGIHLLYLDQHGNVTSLPAIVDHSHFQMMNKGQENKRSLSGKEPKKSLKRSLSGKEQKKSLKQNLSREEPKKSSKQSLNGKEPKKSFKQSLSGKEPQKSFEQSLLSGKEPKESFKQSLGGKEPKKSFKQSLSGEEPKKSLKQGLSGEETRKSFKQRLGGKEPKKSPKQSLSGKEPEKSFKPSLDGKEPKRSFKQSLSGKEPEKSYKQSLISGKEPKESFKQSLGGKEPKKSSKQSLSGKEPEKSYKQSLINGKEPKEKLKQSLSGKEPKQSLSGKEPKESFKRSLSGKEPKKSFKKKISLKKIITCFKS